MTKSRKFIISTLAFAAIAGAGVYGISKTYADETTRTSIVEKIAEKFNLNKDDVQKVFDEERADHMAQMRSNFEKRLSDAVSKGELTEAQKQLILDKIEEIIKEREANRESMMNLSHQERKSKMEDHRKELETWAKDNGIDLKYVMFGMGMGHGRGMMGQGMHRNDD